MLKCVLRLLVVCCLVVGTMAVALAAGNDPFLGEWKLNSSKSKLIDVMKVESAGGNKYGFDFGAGSPEMITVDGTDQAGIAGTTLAVSSTAPDSWKVVRKKDGKILLTAYWLLSKDGNTLKDDYTEFGPDGTSSNVKYVYQRTAGTSGFAGTWEGSAESMNLAIVLKVESYEGDGLSFVDAAQGQTKSMKFDGKDYPNIGARVRPGSASAGRRVDEKTLEVSDKFNGKITNTREIKLSADRKTLTMTVHVQGRREPDVLVFERQ